MARAAAVVMLPATTASVPYRRSRRGPARAAAEKVIPAGAKAARRQGVEPEPVLKEQGQGEHEAGEVGQEKGVGR